MWDWCENDIFQSGFPTGFVFSAPFMNWIQALLGKILRLSSSINLQTFSLMSPLTRGKSKVY